MKTDHGLLAECRATLAFVINVRPLFTGDILETGEAMLVLSSTVGGDFVSSLRRFHGHAQKRSTGLMTGIRGTEIVLRAHIIHHLLQRFVPRHEQVEDLLLMCVPIEGCAIVVQEHVGGLMLK
jgi:hypothetical protein